MPVIAGPITLGEIDLAIFASSYQDRGGPTYPYALSLWRSVCDLEPRGVMAQNNLFPRFILT